MSYREWQVLRAPVWLQDPDGAALEGELGGAKDDLLELVRQGVLARFPDFGASDAQDGVGADRQLPRGYRQADPAFAARLKDSWDLWPGTDEAPGGAGSPAGMLRELKTQGFWPAMIVTDTGRYTTLDGSGNLVVGWLGVSATRGRPDWRFDDRDKFWSQFAIVFPGPIVPAVQVTATAVFTGTDRATAVWSQPWDDVNYYVAASPPITAGPPPAIALDLESITPAQVDVIATAAFTGTVSLLSWLPGTDPLSSPSLSTQLKLRNLARLWKPGNVTYWGAIAIVRGGAWGWPLATWGELGDVWDINAVIKIEP